MDLIDFIRRRRSARRFRKDVPTKEMVMDLLESARFAHSLGNLQALRYTVSVNKSLNKNIQRLASMALIHELGDEPGDSDTPPIYIICSAPRGSSPLIYGDIGAAYQNMSLTALGLGLSMFWIHRFCAKAVHELMEFSENKQILAIFVLGYPGESAVAFNVGVSNNAHEEMGDTRILQVPKLRANQITTWID